MGISSWIMAVVALVALWAGAALGGPRGKPHYDPARAGEYFEQFVADHGRQYGSEQEKQRRLAIFTQNLAAINERNQRDEAVHGITKFSDMEIDEFRQKYLGYKKSFGDSCGSFDMSTIQNASSDDAWDWRAKNAVTGVKDQGDCGSCWAFSTIGNVEGQLAIKHKTLVPLSEQELLECDNVDQGCNGGDMIEAMQELKKIGGVMSEADYPYDAHDIESCRFNLTKSKVKVTGCKSFLSGLTEDKLKVILKQTGPLSIAVDANDLQNYDNGIMTNCDGSHIDHGVLLVGYGIENGTPFWIVKNSWGSNWGEEGYYRVKIGINGCGILNDTVATAIVE